MDNSPYHARWISADTVPLFLYIFCNIFDERKAFPKPQRLQESEILKNSVTTSVASLPTFLISYQRCPKCFIAVSSPVQEVQQFHGNLRLNQFVSHFSGNNHSHWWLIQGQGSIFQLDEWLCLIFAKNKPFCPAASRTQTAQHRD